jgi:hypothetical protein
LQHAVGIAEDIVVPETENAIAFGLDEFSTGLIVSDIVGMLPTVDLDDESLGKADKIREIRTDRHLATPSALRQTLSKRLPQTLFGIR